MEYAYILKKKLGLQKVAINYFRSVTNTNPVVQLCKYEVTVENSQVGNYNCSVFIVCNLQVQIILWALF